jgi:hypothetical protein
MAVVLGGDLPGEVPDAGGPNAGTPDAGGPDAGMPVADQPRRRRRRSRARLGIAAFGLAAALALTDVLAIALASAGYWSVGTVLGVAASGLTILSLGLGLAAIVLGRGRGWGIAASILSLVANPWLLTRILSFFAQF